MKAYAFSASLKIMIAALTVAFHPVDAAAQRPASVFLTAGQSNADGRVRVEQLPGYLKDGYEKLHYADVTSECTGTFGKRTFTQPKQRWAFCDVTNYLIEKALDADFYAVKATYGGTAIDTAATYPHRPVWCADAEWLGKNSAYRGDIATGKSLTKSLTEGFAMCVDSTLSKLPQGYDVKAIMWHQGESDRSKASHYYKNFKDMICYMRESIWRVTGDSLDLQLPFIFGTVPHHSKQYSKEVEEAQRRVAAELPCVYVIDLSEAGLQSDTLHFNEEWTERVGKLMFEKLKEAGCL
ncbi:MAG: sialate O-acetylesterase [Prevotella sp.]